MIPVPADYDGVGRAEVAAYQPSSGTWFIQPSNRAVSFGGVGIDSPTPSDYDGDGKVDIAVYRNPTAEWFIQGTRGTNTYGQFGRGGTGPTLRSLGAISLAAPGIWAGWVASPGADQNGSSGWPPADVLPVATPTPVAAVPVATPTPTAATGGTAGTGPAQRSHRKVRRHEAIQNAASQAAADHRGRSRSSKKA